MKHSKIKFFKLSHAVIPVRIFNLLNLLMNVNFCSCIKRKCYARDLKGFLFRTLIGCGTDQNVIFKFHIQRTRDILQHVKIIQNQIKNLEKSQKIQQTIVHCIFKSHNLSLLF
ncbi:hypothetical protein ACKWTF_011028 [Chironomus riparius]